MQTASLELADIALFVEPYCMDGRETRTGRKWYARLWLGKTRGKGQTWEREPLYLGELSAPNAAYEIFHAMDQERRLQPLRCWIDIMEQGAAKPKTSVEGELSARVEVIDIDTEPEPQKKGLDAALAEGNVAKLVGHVIYGLSQQNEATSRDRRHDLEQAGKRIIHLETMIGTLTEKSMVYVTEREEWRAKCTIMEARTGIMIANAIRDGMPLASKAVEAWAKSRGSDAPPSQGNGNKPPPKPDEPKADPEKQDPGALLDELMQGAMALLQADPSLITVPRYHMFAEAFGQIEAYAQFHRYPAPGAPAPRDPAATG